MGAKQFCVLTTTESGARFGTSKTHLSSLVASAAVRSKVVVLSLLICFLMCFPFVAGVLYLSLFRSALLCVRSSLAIVLKRNRELVAFIVLRMSCYCKCSVTLPHGAAVGLQCVIGYFLIIPTYFLKGKNI